MAASLFEQVKALAPPEVVEHLAGAVGETPQATDRALTGAAIPAVLGGLVQQFSSGTGPARLLEMVKQQDPNGRLLDNLPAGLKGAAPAGLGGAAPAQGPGQGLGDVEHAGQGVIGTLFGQRSDQVADAVATHAGIRKSSAMSLLSVSGAMILGWLGQRVARGGLDAAGLGAMLTNAKGELGRIAPPGLAAAIGAPAVAGVAEPKVVEPKVAEPAGVRPGAAAREPAGTYAASAAAPRDAIYRDEAGRKAAGAPARPSWLSWLIPALIVLGLAAWLLSRLHVGAPHVPTPSVQPPAVPQAQAPAAPTITAPTAPQMNAPTINAPRVPVQLPNGAQLNLAQNSVAYGLARYLGDPNAPAGPQRFAFRNLTFPTAGNTLSGPSQAALNDVAAVLRAYPNATVQIQGFTDNIGGAEANLALSQQRAAAVRTDLIQRGVAPDRITARGFGENNPIASNATPSGRAENRRTDLLVESRG